MEHISKILAQIGDTQAEEKAWVWIDFDISKLPFHELLGLYNAKKLDANAVLFRRFPNNKASEIEAYLYDFSDTIFDKEKAAQLHKAIWSSENVSVYFLFYKNEIRIINGRKPISKKGDLPQLIDIITDLKNAHKCLVNNRLSTKYLASGQYFDFYKNDFLAKNSPYRILLDHLKKTRENILQANVGISMPVLNKFLVMTILLKYLEEKEDNDGRKLTEIGTLWQKYEVKSAVEIIQKGQIIAFLQEINQKFNGKIFALSSNEIAEINELSEYNRTILAEYLGGTYNPNNKNYYLWSQYSFHHLPVELISGIYEAFITAQKDVVYTPPYLVNLLIDECMPLNKSKQYFDNESFSVLDPSCGSGIFLVSAYHRLIDWWIMNHNQHKPIAEWQAPSPEILKRILKNNIFGIDLQPEATQIAIYSLCVALCDRLSPLTIWNELQFEDLSSNIQFKDFFQFYQENAEDRFDLVIGNPPFNPPEGQSKKVYIPHIKEKYAIKTEQEIPDNNVALFFWDKAIELVSKKGNICLLIPANCLLYSQNAYNYRKHFLEKYYLHTIIDCTHLRRILFKGRDVPVCAFIANKEAENKPSITHIVAKRILQTEKYASFELDYYDYHKVPYDIALNNHFVWKTNLLGGGRLFYWVERLQREKTLEQFMKKHALKSGVGYNIAYNQDNPPEKILNNPPIEYIYGKETIIADTFDDEGNFETKIETAKWIQEPRVKALYEPPHIILHANIGGSKLKLCYVNKYVCFTDSFIGIYADEQEDYFLKEIANRLQSIKYANLYQAYILSTSGYILIDRERVIKKADIDHLPFPEHEEKIKPSYSEQILIKDVLDYMMHLAKASENSPLYVPMYVPNVPTSVLGLKEYGEVFCKILNATYDTGERKFRAGKVQVSDMFICYPFYYGESERQWEIEEIKVDFAENIQEILLNQLQINAYIQKLIRFHGIDEATKDNIVYFIKPNTKRYWLKSIAIRDADETFSDLVEAGY